MTNDELNAALATRVMGWEFRAGKDGDIVCPGFDNPLYWSPATEIGQAMQALETWRAVGKERRWEITRVADCEDWSDEFTFACTVWVGARTDATADTPQLAICRALVAATGGEA